MLERRYMIIGGKPLKITISDEDAVLLAVKSAGGAAVGITGVAGGCSIESCRYAVSDIGDIDRDFLIYTGRRSLGLPLGIALTERLSIRELALTDMEALIRMSDADTKKDSFNLGTQDAMFRDREFLASYIEKQYGYFNYGIWGVFDRFNNQMAGKAGILSIDGDRAELSYHIDRAFRGRGYALEACAAIQDYARDNFGVLSFYVRLRRGNTASEKLAEKLGADVEYL